MQKPQNPEPNDCEVGPEKDLTGFDKEIEMITVTEFLSEEASQLPPSQSHQEL